MAEKRKRGQNFTLEDKDMLLRLVLQYKDTLLNKKTDGATNDSKCKAWIEITNAFNSSGTTYRPKDSLMKLWEKMKSEGKTYYSSLRRNKLKTGGGPSDIKTDPIMEQVCSIMGIVGINNSDADWMSVDNKEAIPKVNDSPAIKIEVQEFAATFDPEDSLTNSFVPEDSLTNSFVPEDPLTNSFVPEDPVVTKNTDHLSECSVKTPLWSRRRRRLSQNNERSEPIASFNQKKDVEVLKLKMIQMEIEFKKKLYELQLQAAATEVEIKKEILSQIKGGNLALYNLLGAAPKKTD